jgi:hypothetical protein
VSSFTALGSFTNAPTSTSAQMIVNTNVAVGSLVVVRFTLGVGARPAGLACNDGGSNTYAIAVDGGSGTTYTCQFWSVLTTGLLGATDPITVSWTTTTGRSGIDAIFSVNPNSSTPLDFTQNNFQSAVTAVVTSVSTASPATSDWVGSTVIAHNVTSVTPQASWSEQIDVAAVGMETQAIIGTSTAAIQGAGTLNASGNAASSLAVFKLGVATRRPRLVIARQAIMSAASR